MTAVPKFWRRDIRKKISELEREFIDRRNSAQCMLDRHYIRASDLEQLQEQKYLINALAIEASRLDDKYRACFIGKKEPDPNYEQLAYMLEGAKKLIAMELRRRHLFY